MNTICTILAWKNTIHTILETIAKLKDDVMLYDGKALTSHMKLLSGFS